MKGKDTNSASDQMTFVHSPQHQAPTPASNVSAGSAWAKPLVYQAPGNDYSPSSPGGSGQNSATVCSFFCTIKSGIYYIIIRILEVFLE
jgi:hypothetical protein